MANKFPGYVSLNDSKSALEVFVKSDESQGFEVAREIAYGHTKDEVGEILNSLLDVMDLGNLQEVLFSEKYNTKFI